MTTATYIETLCQSCGKRLRVDAEHVGKKARCPACRALYTVPDQCAVSQAGCELVSPAAVTGETWQVKAAEGLVYGPVSKAELDKWHDQGRITRRSQLLPTDGQRWLWATEVYPDLELATPMTAVPLPAHQAGQVRPTTATLHPHYTTGIEPHRGLLVLVLSIISIPTLCAFPALIGLILGLYDLRLMKAGKMDPSGRRMTIAGVVVGAAWTVLSVGLWAAGLAAWMMH